MGPLAILLNFFVFSCGCNIFGVVVSDIVAKIGIAESNAGSLLSVYQAGTAAALALSPLLVRRLSSGGLLRFGMAAQILGFLIIFAAPDKIPAFIAYAVLGLGGFYIDSGSNSHLADNFPKRKERLVPLLHFVYSFGALVCGYLVLPFKSPGRWHLFYGIAAALMGALLLSGLFSRRTRTAVPSPAPEAGGEGGQARALVRDRPFILYCLVMLCYGAAQQICASWFPFYMEKELLASPVLVATANTCFWTGIAVSRLLGSFVLGRGVQPLRLTAWGLALSFLGQTLALLTSSVGFSLAMMALCGFASGSTIPFFIVEASAWRPGWGKVVSVFYILSLSIGRMVFPYAVTLLSPLMGLRASLLGAGLLFLAGAALAWAVLRLRRRS